MSTLQALVPQVFVLLQPVCVAGSGSRISARASQDIIAKAASVNAAGALSVSAGNNITITAGQASQSLDTANCATSKGLLSSRTLSTRATSQLQAAGNTSSGRMHTLAAANAAMNVKQAADAVQAGQAVKDGNAGGIGISISVGSSSSQSNSAVVSNLEVRTLNLSAVERPGR